jgi:hypothetical protein
VSKKNNTSTKPWGPVQGDILGSVGTVRDVVGRNQGNLEDIAGGIQSHLGQLGQSAFGDNPLLNAGNSYTQDVLGGKYLQDNPYLQGMINQTDQSVSDQVNSLFSKAGASLGTQHAGVLSKSLADAENSLRYGNYAQERQNQQGALGAIPGLSSAQYAGVMPYLAASQAAGTLPYAGLGALSPIIGLGSGAGTTTQSVGAGNLLGGILGAGLSGWASGGFKGI